jgi:acetyl esterase/lipase
MLLALGGLAVDCQIVRGEEPASAPKLLAGDVACGEGDAAATGPVLDLYGPTTRGEPRRPIVLFIHGGGWRHGDKTNVGDKPECFVSHGYLFASVGYRLDPPATPRDQGADVAAAVAWLHEHAADYGGDGDRIFLMGHSAGAHLAALVGTDGRLLARHDLEPAALGGIVLLDGAGYDVPRQMAAARLPMLKKLYREAFGDNPEFQREASPITHVAKGNRYPLFLIFHVGTRADSRGQSEALAERLREAGGKATTVHEPDKTHLTLNRELGREGDGPTGKVLEFLAAP